MIFSNIGRYGLTRVVLYAPCQLTHSCKRIATASWPTCGLSRPADPRAVYSCQITHVRLIPTSWPTCSLSLPDDPRVVYPCQMTHVQSIPAKWPTCGLSRQLTHVLPIPASMFTYFPWPTCHLFLSADLRATFDPLATFSCQLIYVLPSTNLLPIPFSCSTCSPSMSADPGASHLCQLTYALPIPQTSFLPNLASWPASETL